MSIFNENYQYTLSQIKDYCKSCHRLPEEVSLIAVSKMHPVESIILLYNSGQRIFGESYVQELEEKAEHLSQYDIQWSFVGHLQSNKIAKIVRYASEIQSLSNIKHAAAIAKYATQFKKLPYPVYISINSTNEIVKSGIPLEQAENFAASLTKLFPEIKIMGLMSVPPIDIQDPKDHTETIVVPDLYSKLKDTSLKIGLGKLSLGMTGDLRTAIAAGSTCLRIGTALFGDRNYKKITL